MATVHRILVLLHCDGSDTLSCNIYSYVRVNVYVRVRTHAHLHMCMCAKKRACASRRWCGNNASLLRSLCIPNIHGSWRHVLLRELRPRSFLPFARSSSSPDFSWERGLRLRLRDLGSSSSGLYGFFRASSSSLLSVTSLALPSSSLGVAGDSMMSWCSLGMKYSLQSLRQ